MGEYDDIIKLPHHQSKKHAHISRLGRAAQFAPFAALTGFDSAIGETARLTSKRKELDEESIFLLNQKIQLIYELIKEKPLVEIIYFLEDTKKSGGEYVTVTGNVRRIDDINREIIFTDGMTISIDDIYGIKIFDRETTS